MFTRYLFSILILAFTFTFALNAQAQKLTVEDIIAKHLDSIGSAEKRALIKNQVILGDAEVVSATQRNAALRGKIVLASAAEKNLLGMRFNENDYASETLSFDGRKTKVGIGKTGSRTVLGNFILSNKILLEEGLFGGVLSSSWALLDLANKKAKLSFDGIKKINGADAYGVTYSPRSGDVNIKLYFDKETFRHVQTEYRQVRSASMGAKPIGEKQRGEPSSSIDNTELRSTLIENFSDFKVENGLTLPHQYRLSYKSTGQRGSVEIEWTLVLNTFTFNQNLPENTFDAEAN